MVPPLVVANYFPWYDPGTWDTGCTSRDDRPQDGVYNSDDPIDHACCPDACLTAPRWASEVQGFVGGRC